MKAWKLATVEKDKRTLDAKCKEWLTRAEKIKESNDWRYAARLHDNNALEPRLPVSTRKLTTREEIILLEGAKLNGFIFPPWTHSPSSDEFKHEKGESPFTYVLVVFSLSQMYLMTGNCSN
jgi:hypothetical protein